MMRKQKNWEQNFFNYIESVKHRAFEWGEFDCCLFVANCIFAITGSDLSVKYKGKYKTQKGANKYIKNNITNFSEKLLSKHGFTEKNPNFAGRGDPVLIVSGEGDNAVVSVGIVYLDGKVVAASEQGLTFFAKSSIIKAWGY